MTGIYWSPKTTLYDQSSHIVIQISPQPSTREDAIIFLDYKYNLLTDNLKSIILVTYKIMPVCNMLFNPL